MKRVFIVHRWSGGPADDWRPWLAEQLAAQGWQVSVPAMPDTDTPVIAKWVSALSTAVGTPDRDTYFIGHSIGCQAILRYLETVDTPVGGAVFVAGWFDLKNLEDAETEAIAKPWTETPIDLGNVKQVLPHSTLLISSNDPYDAFDYNKQKFAELGATIVVIENAGHFTEEDGCTELPQALRELEALTPQGS
jgi:predicted alpha/beta hydrolase family esterase